MSNTRIYFEAENHDKLCMLASAANLDISLTLLRACGIGRESGPAKLAIFQIEQVIDQLREQAGGRTTIIHQAPPTLPPAPEAGPPGEV